MGVQIVPPAGRLCSPEAVAAVVVAAAKAPLGTSPRCGGCFTDVEGTGRELGLEEEGAGLNDAVVVVVVGVEIAILAP